MLGTITKRFVMWNNKGGVGKSTLTFHVGSLYAETHPDETVLIVDMCPQANATMTYLGGGTAGENQLIQMQATPTPETIVGFFQHQLLNIGAVGQRQPFDMSLLVKQASQYNANVPNNVYLIPGDGNLEVIATPMSYYANPQAMTNAWANVLRWGRDLCDAAAETLEGNIVVFIDTNPSFALYTQQAMVAADSIIVPFNADDASRTGVGALFGLVYGINAPHPVYQNFTFHALATRNALPLPQVKLFVGNRFTQFQGAARAFDGIASVIRDTAWTTYQAHPHIFEPAPVPIAVRDEFERQYSVDLRDFNSAGVVAANHGIPLSRLDAGRYQVYGEQAQVNPGQRDACRAALEQVVARL